MFSHPRLRRALTLVALAFSVTPVLGQELEEVLVTAQKREQNLQDLTISISAVTSDMIQKRGMETFRDWTDYVPGISIFEGTDPARRTGPEATIRGVTEQFRGQIWEVSAGATTSFMIGEVPYFNADPDLYDMNRVEVLRGPQGTLQGISSMGGTIRFIPNEANTKAFDAQVDVGGGAINKGGNTTELGFVVNLPVIPDVLAFRLSAHNLDRGGFIDLVKPSLSQTGNLTVDPADFNRGAQSNTVPDANKLQKSAARLSATYTPTHELTLKAFVNWQKTSYTNTDIATLNLPTSSGKPVLDYFAAEPLREDNTTTSLDASYDLGFGTLELVGGNYQGTNYEATDNTPQLPTLLAGAKPVLQMNPALPADSFPEANVFPFVADTDISTAELRLQGHDRPIGQTPLSFDYIVGTFYQDESRGGTFCVCAPNWNYDKGPNTAPILTENGTVLSSQGGGHYKNKSVYFNGTLNIGKQLSVAAGVRYFDERFHSIEHRYGDFYTGKATNGATAGGSLAGPGVLVNVGQIKQTGLTPSATVSYKIDADRMLYLTAAQGKRLPQGFPNPTGLATIPAKCTALAQQLGVYADLVNGTTTDSVWSYELGLKSKWLDDRLLVNAAVYYLRWTDLQEAVNLLAFDPSCNAQIPSNVGAVKSKGFELETVFAATHHVNFNAAASYDDAKFSDIAPGVSSSIPGVFLKPGDSVRMVAPWTASAGLELHSTVPPIMDHEGELYLRADWRYVGERSNNFGDLDLLRQNTLTARFIAPSYTLTDLRAGWDGDKLEISIYVSNLFNQLAVYEDSQAVFEPNLQVGAINQPRTVGFHVTKHF
jgi:iron complex outermembrane recepter protein